MALFYGAAHGMITRSDGRMLITRRSAANDYMPLRWDIPGGTVEAGESVEEALRREIEEEVSLDVKVGPILYVHTNLDSLPHRQTFQMVFACELRGGEVRINPLEHCEYQWVFERQLGQFELMAFLAQFRSHRHAGSA
ncbi:NUDIX hydrolase [Bradyrhizobium sp. RT3a]|uniref:NUDIX hydrolase n=1 Tax=unclassified Bradyrhizobium TaxID=2631580 RepID=UPI003395FFC7